jgi:hypothetical protein
MSPAYFHFSFRVPFRAQFIICSPTNRRKIQLEMEKRMCEKMPDIVNDVRRVEGKKLLTFLWCQEKLIYN